MLDICVLSISLFLLFCLDNTKLKNKFGYQKIKSYVLIDYNLYPLGEKFFGKGIFGFYNLEVNVSNDVIREVVLDDIKIVYQGSDKLYSTYLGSVYKIEKKNNRYSVYINLSKGSICFSNLVSLDVSLYQKVEANTIIGSLDYKDGEYYYYYQKN